MFMPWRTAIDFSSRCLPMPRADQLVAEGRATITTSSPSFSWPDLGDPPVPGIKPM